MTRHRPADPVEPLLRLGSEPRSCAFCRSTRDYVDQLAASHIDDRSAPLLRPPPAFPPEQRFLSTPTASTVPTREVSASRSASPQRTTSLFTVCHPQPSSAATSSTGRPRRPTPMVTHLAARDVNNARWEPILGSCSMNDLSAQSGFGHVQRRFRHRSRTGRPNAGKSTNTTVRSPLDHTGPPQASQDDRGLRERITTSKGAPSPHSLTPTKSTSPRPTNSSHMRAGISFHRGPPASDVAYQQPIMEDPSSFLVDSDPPWQIPYSPPIREEPVKRYSYLEPSQT